MNSELVLLFLIASSPITPSLSAIHLMRMDLGIEAFTLASNLSANLDQERLFLINQTFSLDSTHTLALQQLLETIL